MWLTLFLLSFVINVVGVFYIRWLLTMLKDMGEDMSALTDSVAGFATHIKGVYELEMFYGDETLKALFVHAHALVDELEKVDFLLEENEEEPVDQEGEAVDDGRSITKDTLGE